MPSFCKVLGAIAPVDPTAPVIRFQVNLPAAWNCKAVQYGGGGFNGVLITGLEPLRDVPPDVPPPLMQGYVTLGTDSGHQADALPEIQAFALNDEAPDMARVVRAAEAACAAEFIEELPLRYETRIGERGVGLSGGQTLAVDHLGHNGGQGDA